MSEFSYTLEDFRSQLRQLRRLGSLRHAIPQLPGMAGLQSTLDLERELRRLEGMLDAMTPEERWVPALIDEARTRRIATGSGTTADSVARLLDDFRAMRAAMSEMHRRSQLDYRDPGWDAFTRWRSKWKWRDAEGEGPSEP